VKLKDPLTPPSSARIVSFRDELHKQGAGSESAGGSASDVDERIKTFLGDYDPETGFVGGPQKKPKVKPPIQPCGAEIDAYFKAIFKSGVDADSLERDATALNKKQPKGGPVDDADPSRVTIKGYHFKNINPSQPSEQPVDGSVVKKPDGTPIDEEQPIRRQAIMTNAKSQKVQPNGGLDTSEADSRGNSLKQPDNGVDPSDLDTKVQKHKGLGGELEASRPLTLGRDPLSP
jgi:hypothetical protein